MKPHKTPRPRVFSLLRQTPPLASEPLLLEIRHLSQDGGSPFPWSFRLRTRDGQVWMHSGRAYATRAQAEQGFFELLQVMATNQYRIFTPSELIPSRRALAFPNPQRNRRTRRKIALRTPRRCRRP